MKTVGATQSRPHVVPKNGSKARRGQGVSCLLTSAEHNSGPQIPSEQFGKGEGTQIRKNAFLKTAHAAPVVRKP